MNRLIAPTVTEMPVHSSIFPFDEATCRIPEMLRLSVPKYRVIHYASAIPDQGP